MARQYEMDTGAVGGEYEQRFEHTVGADGTHQLTGGVGISESPEFGTDGG
jgi:hypothetical protein